MEPTLKLKQMPSLSILTEKEWKEFVRLDGKAVACVEESFRALARGQVVLPPVMHMDIPEANG